jgi:hypothetical protein
VADVIGDRASVILVAASMGGFTAPIVCARRRIDLLVLLNGMIPRPGANTPYGSMDLDPGEIVDVEVDAAGNVEVTVENGVVTITVGSETQTLAAGESASFDSPLFDVDDAIDAIIAQVQGFMASRDIRNRGTGISLIVQLHVARALYHFHPAFGKAAVRHLIKHVDQMYRVRLISLTARNALTTSLQALLAQM